MNKFLKVLAGAAPILASAIPGGGPIAMAAKAALSGKLGLPADASDQQLAGAVQAATPAQLAEIRRADADFKLGLEKLSVQRESRRLDDVADARERHEKMGDRVPEYLAYLIVGGYVVYGFIGFAFPGRVDTALYTMGFHGLGVAAGAALSYYFGASKDTKPPPK